MQKNVLRKMDKIKYKDIEKDKFELIYIINKMINIYKLHKHYMQVLECEQWLIMLNRNPIQTEYTSDALIVLKNIMNDGANYLCVVENRWDDGELIMNLNLIKYLFIFY